jgi:hypothetical protein
LVPGHLRSLSHGWVLVDRRRKGRRNNEGWRAAENLPKEMENQSLSILGVVVFLVFLLVFLLASFSFLFSLVACQVLLLV